MKKIFVFAAITCITQSVFATCSTGFIELDIPNTWIVYVPGNDPCPAGYVEISAPILFPSPQNGTDGMGTFNYPNMCTFTP